MHARVPHMMAQFVLKIEKLSHIMGTAPILEIARACGLLPRLWLLVLPSIERWLTKDGPETWFIIFRLEKAIEWWLDQEEITATTEFRKSSLTQEARLVASLILTESNFVQPWSTEMKMRVLYLLPTKRNIEIQSDHCTVSIVCLS